MPVFDRNGVLARTEALRPQDRATDSRFVGRLADGTFVAYWESRSSLYAPDVQAGMHRVTSTFVHYGPDGASLDTLAELPWFEIFVLRRGDWPMRTSPPFPQHGAAALAGDRLVAGFPEHYEIGIYPLDGAPRMLVRKTVDPLPVTPEDVEEHRRRTLEEVGNDPHWRRRMEDMLAAVEYPSHHPAFGAVLGDAAGHVWVMDHVRPQDQGPRRWSVFDPEGRWLGTVETPRGLHIREIGEDYVLGISGDELGVDHVRLHRLRKKG